MSKIKAVLGRMKNSFSVSFWNCINKISLTGSRKSIGSGFQSRGKIRFRNGGRLTIGKNVKINSSIMSDPLGGNPCTILVTTNGAEITIGNGSGLSNVAIFSKSRVSIGENVYIGADVCIYDNDFHPINLSDRLNNKQAECKPVTIDDGAFIGAHSIILKGVTVGKGSVIGAGSIVTKSIPDGEIWAGNPAKFIRKTGNSD